VYFFQKHAAVEAIKIFHSTERSLIGYAVGELRSTWALVDVAML